jgi:quercetin dioxygenase-like cupin family protein
MAGRPVRFRLPGMAEAIWFTDALMRIHVTPEQTGGAYAVIEALVPSGHLTPHHSHDGFAEGFYVLEGELTVDTDAGSVVVRPGESAHIPPGEPHTLRATSLGPARALIVSAPAGFAHFLRRAGTPAQRQALPVVTGPLDSERVRAAAEACGVRVLGSLTRDQLPEAVLGEARSARDDDVAKRIGIEADVQS